MFRVILNSGRNGLAPSLPITHRRWKNPHGCVPVNSSSILLFAFITAKEHVNKNILRTSSANVGLDVTEIRIPENFYVADENCEFIFKVFFFATCFSLFSLLFFFSSANIFYFSLKKNQ